MESISIALVDTILRHHGSHDPWVSGYINIMRWRILGSIIHGDEITTASMTSSRHGSCGGGIQWYSSMHHCSCIACCMESICLYSWMSWILGSCISWYLDMVIPWIHGSWVVPSSITFVALCGTTRCMHWCAALCRLPEEEPCAVHSMLLPGSTDAHIHDPWCWDTYS